MMTSANSKSQEVSQALEHLSKAKDVREDMTMLMKPYANWEEHLKPAPLSISILGELILISAVQDDFSINQHPPKDGFKYLKNPDSFKASLAQVSHEGWRAFSEAQTNMDSIRLLSIEVPDTVKTIVKILFQDIKVIQAMLQDQLKYLHKIAEECKTHASNAKGNFSALISLVQELLEACLSAKEVYRQALKETQQAIEAAEMKKKAALELKKIAEEQRKKMEQQIDENFKRYNESMDSIPTGWKAEAMLFIDQLAYTIPNLGMAFVSMYAGRYGIPLNPQLGQGTEEPAKSFNMSQINVCVMSEQLLPYVSKIKDMTNDQGNLQMDQIYDQKTGKFNTDWIKRNLRSLKDKINREQPCEAQTKAQLICDKAITICEQLEKIAQTRESEGEKEEVDEAEKKRIVDEILTLQKDAMSFDSYAKTFTNSPALNVTPPHISRSQQELATQGSGTGSRAVENALLRAQQSQKALKIAQDAYQKSFENFKKQNDELAQIFADMKKLEVNKIDFEMARKMLVRGLKALGKVEAQWEKMLNFFNMVSNLIESCLNQDIEKFIIAAEGIEKIVSYTPKSFIADTIYHQAFTVSIVAQLVNMIAGTYYEVSEKHLMDQISLLGRLITMEPSDPDFKSERDKLIHGCDEAQKAIAVLLAKEKAEFENSIQARADAIEATLNAALPIVDKETKKAIEEAVSKGSQEATKSITPEEEDQYD